MTRRSKYTPERVRAICRHIAEGVPVTHAAALADITYSTFAEWRASFAEFAEAVQKAEAELIARRLRRIEAAGAAGSWQADAWTLERRFPDLFGRTERHELTGKDGGPISFTIAIDRPAQDEHADPDTLPDADLPSALDVPGTNVRRLLP